MIKKIGALSIVVVVAAISGYAAHSYVSHKESLIEPVSANSRSIEDIQAEQGKPVRVTRVAQKTIEMTQTFYGTAVPYAEANVQTKHGGTLVALKGEEGDAVNAGDIIVMLDDRDDRLQLEQAIAAKNSALQSVKQAESNAETVQTDLQRYQQLLKDGFVSKQNVNGMQNQAQVALANLQSAREQVKNSAAQIKLLENTLNETRIAAPISGIIDEKHFNLNEITGKEDVIYHIVDIDRVYIEVDVPESYISAIQEQMNVKVAFDSLSGQEFSGVVDRIIPTGNRQSRNFIAKVLVDNPDHLIKPSMFARVSACLEEIPNALVFDKKTLLKDGDDYYVFKVNGNQVERVAVTVKHREEQMVAVLSDALAPQDQIVIEGARLLNQGDRVNVL